MSENKISADIPGYDAKCQRLFDLAVEAQQGVDRAIAVGDSTRRTACLGEKLLLAQLLQEWYPLPQLAWLELIRKATVPSSTPH